MAVLRSLAEIAAAGYALRDEQGWPPLTQAEVDADAALLAPYWPRPAQAQAA